MRELPKILTDLEIQNLLQTEDDWKLETNEGISFLLFTKNLKTLMRLLFSSQN